MGIVLLPEPDGVPGVILTPTTTCSEDITSPTYVLNILAAGGVTLTPEQLAVLPSLITSATEEIERYCSRRFALATYLEIVAPEGGRQDRGEPASAKLSAFPVQGVKSVLTCRSTVLTVTNNDTATNQYATVKFLTVGDVEWLDVAPIGLCLARMASGVTSEDLVLWKDAVTLGALATAVNAFGHGWSAQVQGDYGAWPSANLVGVREPKDALSQGACLDLFTKPARNYEIERSTGILRCSGWDWYGAGWGPGSGRDDAWGGGWGNGGMLGWSGYQVTYQAGWKHVPDALQRLCAEVVKGMYSRIAVDPSLKSENADKYSYALRDTIDTLPDWARSTLTLYKEWSC